jgi:hypothetical protein
MKVNQSEDGRGSTSQVSAFPGSTWERGANGASSGRLGGRGRWPTSFTCGNGQADHSESRWIKVIRADSGEWRCEALRRDGGMATMVCSPARQVSARKQTPEASLAEVMQWSWGEALSGRRLRRMEVMMELRGSEVRASERARGWRMRRIRGTHCQRTLKDGTMTKRQICCAAFRGGVRDARARFRGGLSGVRPGAGRSRRW